LLQYWPLPIVTGDWAPTKAKPNNSSSISRLCHPQFYIELGVAFPLSIYIPTPQNRQTANMQQTEEQLDSRWRIKRMARIAILTLLTLFCCGMLIALYLAVEAARADMSASLATLAQQVYLESETQSAVIVDLDDQQYQMLSNILNGTVTANNRLTDLAKADEAMLAALQAIVDYLSKL